jgi:hypothetical protein
LNLRQSLRLCLASLDEGIHELRGISPPEGRSLLLWAHDEARNCLNSKKGIDWRYPTSRTDKRPKIDRELGLEGCNV